jgi:multimeric flavodoxin WrbA
MKVLAILGSARNNGNSSKALESCIKGIEGNDAEIEIVKLGKLNLVKHCIGCDGCKKNQKKICIQKDDLVEIINKVREADSIIKAAPIYYFGFNSLTKAFIDRTFYSSVDIDNGFNLLANKRFGLIITYGDADVYKSGATNAISNFKDVRNYVGFKIEDIIYGTGNEITGLSKQKLNQCKKMGRSISR